MKKYNKTHKLEKAAKNHLSKIKKRGGIGKIQNKKGKFEIKYAFPGRDKDGQISLPF